MFVKTFYFNPLRTCCYLLYDATGQCVVVDPGSATEGEHQRIAAFVNKEGLQPQYILNTHGHFDHILGNNFVSRTWDIPCLLHEADLPFVQATSVYAAAFGMTAPEMTAPVQNLRPGETLHFGETHLQVLHCPGHSPGSVAFYHKSQGLLFAGDTLFAGSVGRTDLPGGHYETLLESLQRELLPLPDGVIVYPGHGPTTTIGQERTHNPYFRLYA